MSKAVVRAGDGGMLFDCTENGNAGMGCTTDLYDVSDRPRGLNSLLKNSLAKPQGLKLY